MEKNTNRAQSTEILIQQEQRDPLPQVTVAISLYNYRQYIIPCLESVQAQTLRNLDVVIVDDASSDDSGETARSWLIRHGSRFSNYLLLRSCTNKGPSVARNTAFAHARTEYVFVLDADNVLYPRCLQRLTLALDHCEASFAYCYLERFGEKSGLQNLYPWDPSGFKHGNKIDAMALLRKRVWKQVGGYATHASMRLGWEDFELWFKIARMRGWGVFVPEVLARYRVHRNSRSDTTQDPNIHQLAAYLRATYPEFW